MKIFYSLAGEGLGHAIRTTAILENLDKDIEVHLFTWGEAYKFFYEQNYPNLHKIASLHFGRDKNHIINPFLTLKNFLVFCRNYSASFGYIARLADKANPDLMIADFECILPRVAHAHGYPLFSIDNQHRFSRCELKGVSASLRFYARCMGMFTELYVPRPQLAIISTFQHADLKKLDARTVIINSFVRKSLEQHPPVEKDYILLYYKSSFGGILEILAKIGENVKVYGCPPQDRITGNFEYCEISNEGFVKDLSGCKHLICGAGNQLLGEGVFYGKPIMAIPEPNQPEQTINAFYIEKMQYGIQCDLDQVSLDKVRFFLDNFKCRQGTAVNGAQEAVQYIHNFLKI